MAKKEFDLSSPKNNIKNVGPNPSFNLSSNLSPIDFYNKAASDFNDGLNQPFYERIAEDLLNLSGNFLPPKSIKSILEVGAGCGFATRKIREQYPKAEIIALEPAQALFNQGKVKISDVHWLCQKLADFKPKPPIQFDLVVSSMSYHWLSLEEQEKLLSLGNAVALAIPISSNNLNQASTNQFLTKLVRSLKVKAKWARDVRKGDKVLTEINKYFPRVIETDLSLREPFAPYQSLIKALYSRGVLLALFDGQAELVKKILHHSHQEVGAIFNWKIKLIVGINP